MASSYVLQIATPLAVVGLSAIFWNFRKALRTPIPYEAPIKRTKDVEREAPGQYVVILRLGYSLQQHSVTTGRNIQKHVIGLFNRAAYKDQIVYGGRDIGPEMLAAIRADKGVMSLSPDYLLNLEPHWDG